MKIALLHETFWPEIGGVEQVMRDQARLLLRQGHEIAVVTGAGADPGDGYQVALIPELAPDFPLNAEVAGLLARGQADQTFAHYHALLLETLRPIFAAVDLTLVHNIFTMHRNLALTRVLHDFAPEHRMIAWTHDLAAGNPDYALPTANRPPWSLVRTTSPHVAYVTVSDRRAAEIEGQLKPPVSAVVVPDPLDQARLFGLSAEVVALLPSLGLAERDFIFLLPAPIAPRKNLDFALSVVRQVCDLDRDPLLLVTGPAAAGQERYADFVRQSLPRELRGHVVFLSDYFLVRDDILRDLYLLADCLLLPAVREGFGLPVIEAAAFRLPIWGQEIPAFQALAAEGAAFLLDGISRVPEAVEWLESQTTFRQQRLVRRAFDPAAIYHDYYRPLFGMQPL